MRQVTILSSLFILSACQQWQLQPEEPKELPTESAAWKSEASQVKTLPLNDWWPSFAPQELKALVAKSAKQNLQLQEAQLRLLQARELEVQAGAARKISVDAKAGAGDSRNLNISNKRIEKSGETYSFSFAAAYEVDLWGRLRAGVKQAEIESGRRQLDIDTLRLSIASETARRWIDFAAEQQRLLLLEQQLKRDQERLKLIKMRFTRNRSSLQQVRRQEQNIISLQAQIPTAQQRSAQAQNNIALQLGYLPSQLPALSVKQLPELVALPHQGLPADLLRHRPDLQAARLLLEQRGWSITAAEAERLPKLRLSLTLADSANSLHLLLQDMLLSLAADLSAPLVDGGRRKSEIRLRKLQQDEAWLAYKRVFITAINEVENLLIEAASLNEQQTLRQQELDFARQSEQLAGNRYRKGRGDFLEVLEAQNGLNRLEQQFLDLQRSRLQNRLSLYRALGGDWHNSSKIVTTPAPGNSP